MNSMSSVYTPLQSFETKFLTDYSKKDAIWDDKKNVSEQVEQRYSTEQEFERIAKRMSECGLSLGFAESVDTATGEIQHRLKTAHFCHVRNCPTCSWRRTMRNKREFLSKLPKVLEAYPTHRFLFLTLTVPNCNISDLRATLSDMGKSWKRLINRKEFAKVDGWVRSTEVTYSKSSSGNAHPHFHVMLMVKPSYFNGGGYVKQDQWLKAWQGSMRDDSITQVDIRAMKGDKAISEVLKYAVKESDLVDSPKQWFFELTRQVHKLRFIATGGLLKDMLKEEMTTAEMIAGDETESEDKADDEVKLLASWSPSKKRYKAKYV